MNGQFLLFLSLCVFLIASSAYGEPLPEKIRSEYTYCYEMIGFVVHSSTLDLPESVLDNLCLDEHEKMYHFLSSEQGGTISYIAAPRAGMNVVFLVSLKMGVKLNWPSRDTVTFFCQFTEPAHILRFYNDIYESLPLNREDVTIGRIEKLASNEDEPYGSQFGRSVLTQRAGLYTEIYRKRHPIFVFKEESASGDAGNPVLIYMSYMINISDVLANNNVVIRFAGYDALTVVVTFRNKSEADHFYDLSHRYIDPDVQVPIPPTLREILEETH